MGIKKKINPVFQHKKTISQLEKAGISGLVISDLNGQTSVTMFGAKARAFMAIQAALKQIDYLNAAAHFVVGPKITAKKEGVDAEGIEATDIEPTDEAVDDAVSEPVSDTQE